MSSVAERTREAVRARPFLHEALRADVVNFTAAAELLDLDADTDTVAVALRRYAADLPAHDAERRRVRVTMRRGVGIVTAADLDGGDDAFLRVGDAAVVDDGEATALLVDGDVDGVALAHVVSRLETDGQSVVAAGVAGESLVVVVEGRGGAAAVRTVEDSLDATPVVSA